MTVLTDYRQFDGLHWETGSVRNFFDYRGFIAPHTGKPYSEALLLGVSGGIVMGYFSFVYEGYDPQARILTRNTFDPWDRMLSRLGVIQDVRHTTNPDKGLRNLIETLDEGSPAVVWADAFSLPYNALPFDDGMWAMFPLLVYGYDEAAGLVHVADRARVPLTTTAGELAAARARVKKDKFRIATLEAPDPAKLAAAAGAGIWDTIRLYTEAPPKGTKNNFGLAAFRWWAELLTKPKARLSWERVFPAGAAMLAGLTSIYEDVNTFGKDGRAERDVYAGFLDEAAVILRRPGLNEAAERFRRAAVAWDELSLAVLPDDVEPLRETRDLLRRRHQLFLSQGNAALPAIRAANERLAAIKAEVTADFPLDQRGVEALRARIAGQIMRLYDLEEAAVDALKAAMTV